MTSWRRLGVGIFCLGIAASAAATSLDQEALPLPSGLSFTNDNDTSTRQEFLVGRTGLLTQIDVYITVPSTDLCCWLEVFDGASRVATAFVPGEGTSAGWVSFLFATPLSVTAGRHLFFDLQHDNYVEVAASDYAAGGLDWECHIDGCANPFRANPGYAADRIADGTLVVYCVPAGSDCSDVWSGPYDPFAADVEPQFGFHMPIDYAFRTYVVAEPALASLLSFGLAAVALRHRLR